MVDLYAMSESTDLSEILNNLNDKYYRLLKEYRDIQDDIRNFQGKSRQLSLQIKETKQAMTRLEEITQIHPQSRSIIHKSEVESITSNLPHSSPNEEISDEELEKITKTSHLPGIVNWKKLKLIRVLKEDGKSKYVHLLERNIVKKRYDKKNLEHIKAYHREVTILKHLEKCSFVPKILHLIPDRYTIFMTYCGTEPPENPQSLQKISGLAKKLFDEYSVYRVEDEKMTYKINLNNTCWDNKNFYLIDFGSSCWRIQGKVLPL